MSHPVQARLDAALTHLEAAYAEARRIVAFSEYPSDRVVVLIPFWHARDSIVDYCLHTFGVRPGQASTIDEAEFER